MPPEVLGPADGSPVAAGTAPAFQVRSHPGDQYLWVHVSRSPAPADACGTIGRDAASASLEPTADPSVYAATARTSDLYDFWLNRPGTYYWQAYRIHYGDGADGCVEAPVRTLVVTGVRPIEIGPQPTSPAPDAVLRPGRIAFGATGIAGDDALWLHVSRSPATDAEGVLGSDVESGRLVPTAQAGVFTAAPTYSSSPTFWMNRPGTYYWQAHRISSFGDPDGRVEGPVRRFVIRNPAPLALSAARLSGDFTATERVTATRGFGTRVGRVNRSTWTFTPTCRGGACSARLTLYGGVLGSRRQSIRLVRRGAVYAGSGTVRVATCNLSAVRGPLTVTVRVTRGAWIRGTWRATRIAGSFRKSAGATVSGRVRCPAGYVASSVAATLG